MGSNIRSSVLIKTVFFLDWCCKYVLFASFINFVRAILPEIYVRNLKHSSKIALIRTGIWDLVRFTPVIRMDRPTDLPSLQTLEWKYETLILRKNLAVWIKLKSRARTTISQTEWKYSNHFSEKNCQYVRERLCDLEIFSNYASHEIFIRYPLTSYIIYRELACPAQGINHLMRFSVRRNMYSVGKKKCFHFNVKLHIRPEIEFQSQPGLYNVHINADT